MGPGLAAHRSRAVREHPGHGYLSNGETHAAKPTPIIAGTRIGHVHLKVADLDRALAFYCGVLGFELIQR